MDRHLLSIRTEGPEGVHGRVTAIVVEVAIRLVILQIFVVGIWVVTITATKHITIDIGIDIDGITAIDGTRHVVTTIYIMHIAAAYQRAGRQLVGEAIARQVRTWRIFTIHRRFHVCHTATAIQVINDEAGVILNFKEQTLRRGHRAAVTTTIEVANLTRQQVPRRTDVHLSLIVATKEAAYLISTTTWLREAEVNAHLLEALVGQQVNGTCCTCCNFHTSGIGPDMVHHRTWVVEVDECLFLYCSVVTTTVAIDDRATQYLQIDTILFWVYERSITSGNDDVSMLGDIVVTISQRVTVFIQIRVVAVTAAKELSDIYLLGIRIGLHIGSPLAIGISFRISCSSNLCRSISFYGITYFISPHFRADAHIAVEGVGDDVFRRIGIISRNALHRCQFRRNVFSYRSCRTYLAGDIVTAKYLVDQNIAGGVLAIDVHEGASSYVSHTCTTKHLTTGVSQWAYCSCVKNGTEVTGLHRHPRAALHLCMVAATIYVTTNLNLPLCYNRAQECKNQYGNISSHP